MKQLALTLSIFSACCRLAFAGTAYTGKEMKQVAPAPCPQWYADNEWNVSLWGTYAATGTEFAPNPSLADIVQSTTEGHTVYGTFDKYLAGGPSAGIKERTSDERAVGEVLGTFTLRYPIQCSRFSPYVWAGGGVIFGGGERDEIVLDGFAPEGPLFHTVHHGTSTEAVGQFGGGLEFRLTPHVGWMNDFSWNVINGPQNNFGMVRSGLTFAF